MPVQTIKRWGNSLAMRIPASIAEELHLREDQEIEIVITDGGFTAVPAIKGFNWDEYRKQLASTKEGDFHPMLDKGAAVGTELRDPTSEDAW
jgi:antitoxin MazE